ncbi:AlpA family transcriptional regulator [Labrenzia sp. VG12]|uniref:helix-turn-helix transcriptional regulator n=1 Tax=Labrenzia sp. VG12 TaxID=2021862 RepID=UPI0012FDDD17|nr:AlpA family phage regulatory protein [Labrenzia sp. VG12]
MSNEEQSSLFPDSGFSEPGATSSARKHSNKNDTGDTPPRRQTQAKPAKSVDSRQAKPSPKPESPGDAVYLSDKQVAKRISISKATVWRWAKSNPDFPKPIVFSKGVTRWSLDDLLVFEARRKGEAK